MHLKDYLLRSAVAAAMCAVATGAMANGFTIKDIRIEGIARTEPGTVLSHLPFRVGDEFTTAKGDSAIHSLYRSGLFRDVRLEQEGDVLVVQLQERPAVASISTQGIRAFDKSQIEQSLRDVGMAEGRIFDRATLDRADQELRRQYLARGYYGVDVKTTVTPLDRNRVRLSIIVDEGQAAKIKSIRFVGNKVMDDEDLAEQMQLGESGWMSWYNQKDLYSREKLAADIEAIRSFYLNNGYLDFKVDSVQVSIAPNKKDIFITVNVTEGEQYRLTDVSLTGDLLGLEAELKPLVEVELGETYNAEAINNASNAIVDKLSSLGYAFATARPTPVTTDGSNDVKVIFTVDPGRRAYVRKVNITGNTKTQDEVIRREVRQYESAWFDSDKVKVSRDRIDRLGYFDNVTVEHKPVPGTRDQVDLEVNVLERPTGSLSLGAGFSSSDGLILSAGFSQDNIFGTGKSFGVTVDNSDSNKTYSVSLTEPYITNEGISRSLDLYVREVDLEEQDIADVVYETRGAAVSWGIPITETDRVFVGAKWENTVVDLNPNSPQRYHNYVQQFGEDPHAFAATIGWSRDSRDSALVPTRGTYQRVNGELALPVLDLQYYRMNYQIQHYYPLTKKLTFAFNGEIGYGDGYGDKAYPFFKNFYAGGIGSVRGYESSSLGPKDDDGDSEGGSAMANFSFEILAPLPGADRTLRMFAFLDGGMVWGDSYHTDGSLKEKRKIDFGDMRYSVGLGIAWISPLGPLKFSIAAPLNKQDGDDIERFQFQIGTGF